LQLDHYVRKLIQEDKSIKVISEVGNQPAHVVQKLLDALLILDPATYNLILEAGVCECHGKRYKVDREGLIVW
jgi:hypothetical protein